jgi:hypothetical protein
LAVCIAFPSLHSNRMNLKCPPEGEGAYANCLECNGRGNGRADARR